MINREIQIELKIKGRKIRYGIRGDSKFLEDLLGMIRNTTKLLLKENPTPEDKKQIKLISK